MKRLVVLSVISILFQSCQPDTPTPSKGFVTFSLDQAKISSGRLDVVAASAAVISIKDAQGKILYENHKISLLSFGQGYISESLNLGTGSFTLTSFIILNPKGELVYATPVEKSAKAKSIVDALPLEFTVEREKTTQVVPEVLVVNSQDKPESFGYASFLFKVVEEMSIPILVQVKLLVGEFLYEDIETSINVKGFDENGNIEWSAEVPYAGHDAKTISLISGYSHYTISMDKWQVADTQTITAQQLLDTRADGKNPVTYGLGGKVATVKRPIFTLEYREDLNYELQPSSRIDYEYTETGRLTRMTFFDDYSTIAASGVATRFRVFTYAGGRPSKITEYLASNNTQLSEETYEYGVDGSLLRITRRGGVNDPVTGVMSLTYDATNTQAKASYAYSNGAGFDYKFDVLLKNIVDDKTINGGGELCSEGAYGYDRNINPFKHLGYVGYTLDNYSANNKLTENVNYIACAFPSFNPQSYTYKYDALGYPTEKVTHYKGGGDHVTATRYHYVEFAQ